MHANQLNADGHWRKVESRSKRIKSVHQIQEIETKLKKEYEQRLQDETVRLRGVYAKESKENHRKLELEFKRNVFTVEVKLYETEKARDNAIEKVRVMESQLAIMVQSQVEANFRQKVNNSQMANLNIQLAQSENKFQQLSLENQRTNEIMESILNDYSKLKHNFDMMTEVNKRNLEEFNRRENLETGWNHVVRESAVLSDLSANVLRVLPQNFQLSSKLGMEKIVELGNRNVDIEKRCYDLQQELVFERDGKQSLGRNLAVAEATIQMNKSPTANILKMLYKKDLALNSHREKVSRLEKELLLVRETVRRLQDASNVSKDNLDSQMVPNDVSRVFDEHKSAASVMRIKKEKFI